MTEVAEILQSGELEIVGRLVEASNATLRGRAVLDGQVVECVYKPMRGERPLWDFTEGTLGRREVAAFVMSQALGIDAVPLTVWRQHGPYGAGMCQVWVDDSGAPVVDLVPVDSVPQSWMRVLEGESPEGEKVALVHADRADLRSIAVLDIVVNNTDRKGGHVLVSTDDRVTAIDHGVTFHVDDKLRTVLWGWATQPLTDVDCGRLAVGRAAVVDGCLDEWLSHDEVRATLDRIDRLLDDNRMPLPDGSWPPLPWPAF